MISDFNIVLDDKRKSSNIAPKQFKREGGEGKRCSSDFSPRLAHAPLLSPPPPSSNSYECQRNFASWAIWKTNAPIPGGAVSALCGCVTNSHTHMKRRWHSRQPPGFPCIGLFLPCPYCPGFEKEKMTERFEVWESERASEGGRGEALGGPAVAAGERTDGRWGGGLHPRPHRPRRKSRNIPSDPSRRPLVNMNGIAQQK